MVRITNAVASRRRRKRIHKRAKGFWGDRKNHLRMTKEAVMRALSYNYIHRKQKKRNFRKLWITRLAAASKMHGISYSRLIHGLKVAECQLNRKVLADMAVTDPESFKEVVSCAKSSLAVKS